MDDEGIRGLIARARELARGLDRATLERLAADARPRVVEWRWADAHSVPHRPEPWLAAREDRSGGWRSEGGDDVQGEALGFIGERRPRALLVGVLELPRAGPRRAAGRPGGRAARAHARASRHGTAPAHARGRLRLRGAARSRRRAGRGVRRDSVR